MFGDTSARTVPVATDLGAQVLRKQLFGNKWTGSCPECLHWRDAGIGIVLTIRHNGSSSSPSSAVSDFPGYKNRVGSILDAVDPEVLVVENEEDADVFYSGTTEQYLAELRAGCEVAHSSGIKCTNGGLTTSRVIAMTYQHFVDTGRRDQAEAYARSTSLNHREYENLVKPSRAATVEARANEGLALATGYRGAGADFINFHWYREDAKAFGQTAAYLESVSGLTAMANEIGQYDTDPAVVEGLMQKAANENLAYAIWYSIDDYVHAVGLMTRALQDPGGGLRPHGLAFSDFMDGYLGSAGERRVTAATDVTTTRHGNSKVRLRGEITGDAGCTDRQKVRIQQATDRSLEYWTTKFTVGADKSGHYTSPRWSFGHKLTLRALAPAAGACRMATSDPVAATPEESPAGRETPQRNDGARSGQPRGPRSGDASAQPSRPEDSSRGKVMPSRPREEGISRPGGRRLGKP